MDTIIAYKKLIRGNQSLNGVYDFTLNYSLNEWVYPVRGTDGLFVFDTLENAINFRYGTYIYKCEILNPRKIKMIVDVPNTRLENIDKAILDFWHMRKKKQKYDVCSTYVPKGTLLCDGVKLLEQVY